MDNEYTLMLDGVLIPILAGVDLSQSYEEIGGQTLLRTRSGRGVKQSHWKKIKTTVTGSGWIPAALAGLDTAVAHSLDCVAPRLAPLGSTVTERADVAGREVEGGYLYWPRLVGFITVSEQTDVRSAQFGWTLTLEEQ